MNNKTGVMNNSASFGNNKQVTRRPLLANKSHSNQRHNTELWNQAQEDQVSSFDQSYQIKPLDSHFASFGEAVFSYVNCNAYGRDKHIDVNMVRYFCGALCIPAIVWDTCRFNFDRYFFKSGDWLYKYLDDNDWIQSAVGLYFKLDECNRPIASIGVSAGVTINVCITGPIDLVKSFEAIGKANIFFDSTIPYRTEFMDIKIRRLNGGSTELMTNIDVIKHNREALPEYYPYLDGGIPSLIKDFIESDDTVLILYGKPGTGKSSAVYAAAKELNLRPIYATSHEAITHPDFVPYIFNRFDEVLFNYQDPIRNRSEAVFDKSSFIEAGLCSTFTEYSIPEDPMYGVDPDQINRRLPIVIIEDADALLAPRKDGNRLMADLLNATDGVSSNTARKVIFNTNITDLSLIDEGLLRVGRCYNGEPVNFRLLTPEEAVVARKAAGLPDFEVTPTKDMSLAEVMVKPRPKIVLNKKSGFGFSR